MNPRRRALDYRLAWLEASGIDANVIVPDIRSCGFHVAFGNCCDLVVLDTELQVNRALHSRAILWLDEKDARFACSPYTRSGRCNGNTRERSQGQVADNSHDESPLFRDAHSGPTGKRVQLNP